MRKVKLYNLLITLLIILMHQNIAAQDLSEHRWKNRLVLLLVEDMSNNEFIKQLAEFKNNANGLKERKIVTYVVTSEKYKSLHTDNWKAATDLFINYKKNKTPFELVLIGLDGGVKARRTNFINSEDLFAIIDAMPMRQNEIKRQKN
jgi:hypothetical protein